MVANLLNEDSQLVRVAMYEHPESLERIYRERFEERLARATQLRAVRRQLAVRPPWWRRRSAAGLRRLADSLDAGTGAAVQYRVATRAPE